MLGAQIDPLAVFGRIQSLLVRVPEVILGDKLPARDELGQMRAVDKHLFELLCYLSGVFADGNGVTDLKDAHLFESVPVDKGTILHKLLYFFEGGFLGFLLGAAGGGMGGVEEEVDEAIFVVMHNNNANKIIIVNSSDSYCKTQL